MNILLPGHPSNRVSLSVLQSVATSHQQTNTIHWSYGIKRKDWDNYQLTVGDNISMLHRFCVKLQTSYMCFRKLMDAAKFHCL